MSQIIKTEAIVLRSIKYSETSKIVTFYTKELGRVGAIVKGVRKKESKLGSALEPMSFVQLVLYVKESREVQTVAQCDLIKSFYHLASDLDKVSVGFSLIELVYSIAHEQEQNVPLFSHLRETLLCLGEGTIQSEYLLYYFELKLAELLGFLPVFNICGNCKREIGIEDEPSPRLYNVLKGVPVCDNCSGSQQGLFEITSHALKALRTIDTYKNSQQLQELNIDFSVGEEIEGFLNKFLQLHVSGFRVPRSRAIFNGGK